MAEQSNGGNRNSLRRRMMVSFRHHRPSERRGDHGTGGGDDHDATNDGRHRSVSSYDVHDSGSTDSAAAARLQLQRSRRRRVPSKQEMRRRHFIRRNIQFETLNQRGIHKHGGLRDTGRNICAVLRERECSGPNRLVLRQHWPDADAPPPSTPAAAMAAAASPKSPAEMNVDLSNLALNERFKKQRKIEVALSVTPSVSASASASASAANPTNTPDGPTSTDPSTLDHPHQYDTQPRPQTSTDPPGSFRTQGSIDNSNSNNSNSRNGSTTDNSKAAENELLRRVSYPMRVSKEIRTFVEYYSITKYHSTYFNHLGGQDINTIYESIQNGQQVQDPATLPPPRAVSTISIAFSPDSKTMASTHGDHTVKITCCATGKLLETLVGHPRTPWTVKFHPTNPNILASGCLGQKVMIWDWRAENKKCINFVILESAIISLSFHPTGDILAVANGTFIHFWAFDTSSKRSQADPSAKRRNELQQRRRRNDPNSNSSHGMSNSGILTKTDQRHMLRCVHFLPDGHTVIIGGVNPRSEEMPQLNQGGMSGGGMSFYLRLWDFDPNVAFHPTSQHRRIISNPRKLVPRVLLYNDGGFDVSPDGKTLCACAEYWLPNGVSNAMELLQVEEQEYISDDDEGYEQQTDTDSGNPYGRNQDETAHSTFGGTISSTGGDSSVDPSVDGSGTRNGPLGMNANTDSSGSFVRSAVSPSNSVRGSARISTPISTSGDGTGRSTVSTPLTPRTPPPGRSRIALSPPSPPGRRFAGGLTAMRAHNNNADRSSSRSDRATTNSSGGSSSSNGRYSNHRSTTNASGVQAMPQQHPSTRPSNRLPHPLSTVSGVTNYNGTRAHRRPDQDGRYVPHVVTVSLETAPVVQGNGLLTPGRDEFSAVARGHRPRLGQLLEACPLDGKKSTAVTCVKFSPSADFCLIGYGIRDPVPNGYGSYHPVTALYRIRGGMTHVSTMFSEVDDVNIARFHPNSGYGLVYGTKQGRVRVLSPRPWNYYNL